ncbi:MAG: hypothetical protein QXQ77_00505 [Candidatus Aenigmatarchaeota archaeon]
MMGFEESKIEIILKKIYYNLNPCKIISLEERKEGENENKFKLWIIIPLLLLIPLFLLTLGSTTGFFALESSHPLTVLDFILVCLVFCLFFLAYFLMRK